MRVFHVAAAVLLTLSLSVPAAAQAAPAAVSACDRTPSAPEIVQQLTSRGRQRAFRLFVPQNHDGRNRLALVLDMHGSGGNAAGQARTSGFEALAAREGFVVATLQAEGGRWNVPVSAGRADDVAYVSDVIDHVAARACIDPTRVYATGFSGGGRMSSLLACRLSSRIAAIAPMAGLRWPGSCDARPVPVLTFHGLADATNPYEGHAAGRGGEWEESVPEALAGWAQHNKCNPRVVLDDPPGPLATMRYEGCAGNAEVRLIRIDGFPHTWARDEVDATAVMWQFFKRHTLRP